jgi:Domain of unknown function (DUF6766)
MRRHLRDNSLSLFFLTLFVATIIAQSVAGQRAYNDEQRAHDEPTISYVRYLHSSDFGQAVMENWQSEWLQFTLFAFATVWFVQRGSNESKPPDEAGLESDQKQLIGAYAKPRSPAWAKARGWRTTVYGNSLVAVMLFLFLGSWLAQSLTAWNEYNAEQLEHARPEIGWSTYILRADFWEQTLQNWQSEFLAVGTMVVFTIYLRQRGSPESKPVGEVHEVTGTSG